MKLLDDVAEVEARFGLFEISVNLSEISVHSLGGTYHSSKIIMGTPDGMPRCHGSSRIVFRFVSRQCQSRTKIGA
jgi:hypothetical protein